MAGLESFPVAEPLILRMLKGSGKRGRVHFQGHIKRPEKTGQTKHKVNISKFM